MNRKSVQIYCDPPEDWIGASDMANIPLAVDIQAVKLAHGVYLCTGREG